MPVLDPDGLAEITGFTAEDWFARTSSVLDADGVREILGTDGRPRRANIYKAVLDATFEFLTITAENVYFDESGNAKYKVSFVDDKEQVRSISKFIIDE